MFASATLNFDDKIVYLQVLEGNTIAIADKNQNFYLINGTSMEQELHLTLKHSYTHPEKKNISFSPDGKYLAYSEKEQSVVRVIDIKAQKLHHSFPTQLNIIETLCFDPSSSYIVAGSLTGRVFLWNLFSTGQVSRLSSFPEYSASLVRSKINYVSAACFSSSGELVATAGYGGSIVITNIHNEVSPKRITPNRIRINTLCFLNDSFLCSGNIEGGLDIINLRKAQVHKHYQTSLGDINTMCLSNSGRYLFIAGHGHQISLLDLEDEKIIENEYLRLPSKITNITMTQEDSLIVACENGNIHFFTLCPEELLQLHLNTSSYPKCFKLLQEFPLLLESPLINELNEAWQETLDDAIYQVQEAEFKKAEALLNKFANIPSKTRIINEFQGLITHYARFKTAVSHENFAMAYSMADHVPLLQKTQAYQNMEDLWDKVFLKAQAYVIREKTHMLFKLLEPFSRVTSKLCFIQVLLHQPEMFLEFMHHINDHSYEKIFSITRQFPCLEQISSYQQVIESSNDLFIKFTQHIYSGDYELAELEYESLQYISYLKEDLRTLTKLLTLAKKLEIFYQDNNLLEAFTLIDEHPELQGLTLTTQIEKIWNSKMKEAERAALLGHTKKIKLILSDLITLHSRAQKVGMLLRLSYITQMKFLVIKEHFTLIKAAVQRYISLFGFDTELNNLLLKLQKSKNVHIELNAEQEHRRPRGLWLVQTKGKVPDSIIPKQRQLHDTL
ncbi:hypothetical protein JHD50_12030 [Sulfurimonas sp. MAG313]|nr:hypothetical protein [Sulfurimonas sp. MAG313]MDF1882018.1 hypothetical protein [Sulfurimonas sp. MAG313]